MVSCVVQQPIVGPWPPPLQVWRHLMFYGERISHIRRTQNLDDHMYDRRQPKYTPKRWDGSEPREGYVSYSQIVSP